MAVPSSIINTHEIDTDPLSPTYGMVKHVINSNPSPKLGMPYGPNSGGFTLGAYVSSPQPPALCAADLKQNPAMLAPLQTLEDLWLQRFANDWVDVTEVQQDAFFALAYERLKQAGRIEVHYLSDAHKYVCRKPA